MSTFQLRLLMAVVTGILGSLFIGFDYWMSWTNNSATFSKIVLFISTHAPVAMMVIPFWLGCLCGHLFMPQIPLATRWVARKLGLSDHAESLIAWLTPKS